MKKTLVLLLFLMCYTIKAQIRDAQVKVDATYIGVTATSLKDALKELNEKTIDLDDALSTTSTNAVENAVITSVLNNKSNTDTSTAQSISFAVEDGDSNTQYRIVLPTDTSGDVPITPDGDDLGSHTATQDVNMGGNELQNVGQADFTTISASVNMYVPIILDENNYSKGKIWYNDVANEFRGSNDSNNGYVSLSGGVSGIENVIEDLSPELGSTLNAGGFNIENIGSIILQEPGGGLGRSVLNKTASSTGIIDEEAVISTGKGSFLISSSSGTGSYVGDFRVENGKLQVEDLSGVGTRMVVTDLVGNLSSQEIQNSIVGSEGAANATGGVHEGYSIGQNQLDIGDIIEVEGFGTFSGLNANALRLYYNALSGKANYMDGNTMSSGNFKYKALLVVEGASFAKAYFEVQLSDSSSFELYSEVDTSFTIPDNSQSNSFINVGFNNLGTNGAISYEASTFKVIKAN